MNIVNGNITAHVADTLLPWSIYITGKDGVVPDLDDYDTVEFYAADNEGGVACPTTDLIAWTSSNVTTQPAKVFTTKIATGVRSLYSVGHGLYAGVQVKLTTDGTLPTGLSVIDAASDPQRYYVVKVSGHHFWLSELPSGSPIDISNAGSGNHSFQWLGHVQYQPQSVDVDTATTTAFVKVRYGNTGGPYETLPSDKDTPISLSITADKCDA